MHGLVSGMGVNLTAMSLTRRDIFLSCEMSSVFGVLLCISWGKAIGSLSYKFLIMDADLPAYAFYNNWVAPWSIDTLHIFVNQRSRILHVKLVAWPGQDFSHITRNLKILTTVSFKKKHRIFYLSINVLYSAIYTVIQSFRFPLGISGWIFYVFLASSLHSKFPFRQRIPSKYWSIRNVTMEWYWIRFAHFHS
jgi:hypothetical protein